jgi:hypothetical protein
MSEPETRLVTVKPGDVLVLANIGPLGDDLPDLLTALKDELGLRYVLVFERDPDLSVIPVNEFPHD